MGEKSQVQVSGVMMEEAQPKWGFFWTSEGAVRGERGRMNSMKVRGGEKSGCYKERRKSFVKKILRE